MSEVDPKNAPARPPATFRRALLGPYSLAAYAIFAFTAVRTWTSVAIGHEVLYLIGSRRLVDPTYLAADFTWSVLPPTSFLYDHMLAPLWSLFGEFAIVNIGRLVWWSLFAAALAYLARTVGLPAWSAVAGFVAWMLWGQSFALCGSPFEGFQVKSLAYPLLLFSLAFAVRGQVVRAGLSAGLATAMHIIVGGWGCLALFLSMLVERKTFAWRRLAAFLLAASPFVVPLVLAVALFHRGPGGADQARMDEIYVKLAAPKCCEPAYFMNPTRAVRAVVLFLLAPLVVLLWPRRAPARLVGGFVVALVLFFLLGIAADQRAMYGFLKLFPFQLGKSLPALFFFLFVFGWAGIGGPKRTWQKALGIVAVVAALWLMVDRNVVTKLVSMPGRFLAEIRRPEWGVEQDDAQLFAWIRENTPKDSVFVTPFVPDFWEYAERAQVATIRHPPFDHRLIEWQERLVALNRSEPFSLGGYDIIPGLDFAVGSLTPEELASIRREYGATHYLGDSDRPDLSGRLLYSGDGRFVYDLRGLGEAAGPGEATESSKR